MKNIIIIIFSLLTFISYSQIEKNKKIIGLGLSYYNNSEENTIDQISKSLESSSSGELFGGYFLTNSIVLGPGFEYTKHKRSSTNDTPGYYNKSNSNGISPILFVKYYKKIGNQFYFSPKVKLFYKIYKSENLSKQNSTTPEETSSSKTNSMGIDINPIRLGYLINDKYFVEFSIANISYKYSKRTSNSYGNNYQTIYKDFNFDTPSNFITVSFSMVF